MAQYSEHPFVVVESNGSYIVDNNGRSYIDCLSSLWHVSAGHSNGAYVQKLIEQLALGITSCSLFGVAHRPAIEYADALLEYLECPSLSGVFLTSSGSEAAETGIKIAIKFLKLRGRKETRFAYLDHSYHGVTLGALSATGIHEDRMDFEEHLSKLFFKIKKPYDFVDVRAFLLDNAIDALILEPIRGAGGVLVPPDGFLKDIYDICHALGVLVILDEVVTGFWRCGSKFAFLEAGIIPDVLILSKGISGGIMPLGATVIHERIAQQFIQSKAKFWHGHTYGGNPLSCVAGLVHLQITSTSEFIDHLNVLLDMFAVRLKRLERYRIVQHVRFKGLMAAVVISDPKMPDLPYLPPETIAVQARRFGLFMRPIGHQITLFPSLTMSVDAMEEMFSRLAAYLEWIESNSVSQIANSKGQS